MNLSVKSALIASVLLPIALEVGEVYAENVEVAPMIVNGTNASILDFPSFVSLYIDSREYDGRYSSGAYCGGTLLNDTHVMTAAHCLSSFSTYDEGAVLFTSAVVGLENENRFLNAEKQRVEAVFFIRILRTISLDCYLMIL